MSELFKPTRAIRLEWLERGRNMPENVRGQCGTDLSLVAVVSEISMCTGIPQTTLVRWLNEGVLVGEATMTGKIWLVSLRSASWVFCGKTWRHSIDRDELDYKPEIK